MIDGHPVVCVSVSPGLRGVYRPLWRAMQPQVGSIWCWDYEQTLDEAADLSVSVDLLVAYLQSQDQPVHLLGHGLSGIVAWMAAQRCPQQVCSLAVLAVSPQAVTWHSHYYVQRRLLMGSREQVLLRLSRSLFGDPHPFCWRSVMQGLATDLERSPCPHSLWNLASPLSTWEEVSIPLFVGGSCDDPVVDPTHLQTWALKEQDHLWLAPRGRHFFHATQAPALSHALQQFWAGLAVKPASQQLVTC